MENTAYICCFALLVHTYSSSLPYMTFASVLIQCAFLTAGWLLKGKHVAVNLMFLSSSLIGSVDTPPYFSSLFPIPFQLTTTATHSLASVSSSSFGDYNRTNCKKVSFQLLGSFTISTPRTLNYCLLQEDSAERQEHDFPDKQAGSVKMGTEMERSSGEISEALLEESSQIESEEVPEWKDQISFRGLVVSGLLGTLFCIITHKLNLTVGIIPSLNVAAGLLGFFMVKSWTSFVDKLVKLFTRQENTVIFPWPFQSCSTSQGDGSGL
ncbi:hypothetical protein L1987_73025 [Smallanthus sonchifolius]|uniref:Uncharacterized protein n=1 Tax=Smallanthus sonchifolius TaxID=185202 RepID=A0ACB9AYI0_9ASTR|nr:hypothetical protein L1987_73025 [Smallanthus sonchifolius]